MKITKKIIINILTDKKNQQNFNMLMIFFPRLKKLHNNVIQTHLWIFAILSQMNKLISMCHINLTYFIVMLCQITMEYTSFF